MSSKEELYQEIHNLLQEKNGVSMYGVLKTQEGETVKKINIADEQKCVNNTTQGLLDGFSEVIERKMSDYQEDEKILKLSSADERSNGLYYYDLENFPEEMKKMLEVSNSPEEIEMFNFREDSLDRIRAFIVVIGNVEDQIILYKQQYPVSLLKRDRYMLTPILHENRLKKVEQDILRIDFNYQFFLWKGTVYISDIEKMEKICSFHEIIRNEAKKSIEVIEQMNIIDDVESLTDELENVSFARKLTKIYKDSKVIGKIDNRRIIEFTQSHSYFKSNPLKLNAEQDKFILDTKRSKNTFVKLLNDDLLTSELTRSDYEVLAKNNV